MPKITKSEEELTKELNTVIRKLYKTIQGTPDEKESAIFEMTGQAIQLMKNKQIKSQPNSQKKNEQKAKKEKLIQMAKNIEHPDEIAKVLGYTNSSAIYTTMRQLGIYPKRTVIQLLDSKTDEEIAKEGNVEISAVAKVRQEEREKQKGKDSPKINQRQIRMNQAIQMLKELKSADVIMKKLNYANKVGVYHIASNYKIYSRRRVVTELKNKSDEEIAREGNVEISAVTKVRQEENERKAKKEKERSQKAKKKNVERKNPKKERLIQMASQMQEPKEIMQELGYTTVRNVYSMMKRLGIYTKKDVKKLLDSKTDEEIAKEGNVEISAVAKVRQEENEKNSKKVEERKPNTEGRQAKKIENIRNSENKPLTEEERKKQNRVQLMLRFAEKLDSIEAIEKKTGLSKYEIFQILKREGIPTRDKVEKLIKTTKMSDEEIAIETGADIKAVTQVREAIQHFQGVLAKIPETKKKAILRLSGYTPEFIAKKTESSIEQVKIVLEEAKQKNANISEKRKQIDFKIEMMQFRTAIDRIAKPDNTVKSVTMYRIQKILFEYESFLTKPDYAYIAFAYLKIGAYLEAIDIGEQTLGLQESSINALTKRINEVLEEAKKEQEEKKLKSQVSTETER